MSVCPSFKSVNCDERKQISAHILIQYERSMYVVFWHKEWLVADVPFYLKFWTKVTHSLQKRRFPIYVGTLVITASERSSIITIKCFVMNLRWTSYAASKPPKGAQKRKIAISRTKVNFFRRKSATKVACVKTVTSIVVRHSLAYLSSAQMVCGGRPFIINFVHKDTHCCTGSKCWRCM